MIQVFKPYMFDEEIAGAAEVIRSGWIGLGPKTDEFEKKLEEYIGKQHIIATNSATAALHLAMIGAGITEGDEVITPALTFVSTNHVVLYQKGTPVFCDVDPVTLCADPQDILKKITKKTKAITVVHYGGHAVDMDPILKVAKEKGIVVIEDNAHGLGGFYKGKPLGTLGDFGCYSFHAIKGVAMADGGAIYTKKKRDAELFRRLRWMGISKDTWKRTSKTKYSWYYSVEELGFKYHPNDILSAIALVQLKRYPSILKRKREIYEMYQEGLKDLSWVELPLEREYAQSALHNFCIKVPKRNQLATYLANKKIATTVHYIPNNHYDMYKDFSADIPVTEKVWKRILLLPFHPHLTNEEIEYIISTIRKYKS